MKLIFLLVTFDGKGSDCGYKLVVAEGLETARCESGSAERERQSKAQIAVAQFVVIEERHLGSRGADPVLGPQKIVTYQDIVVVRIRRETSRLHRALLNQIVLCLVAIDRRAKEPARSP
jgi:hypothetical protein